MLATWGCTTFPKPTLDLQFAGATSLDNRITFSRGSQATLFDSTGTLVYAKHNLVLQSEDFSTTWTVSGASISTNTIISPAATLTGDSLVEDTSAGSAHRVGQTFTADPTVTYTASCYVKAAGRTWARLLIDDNAGNGCIGWFNLSTGVVGSAVNNGTGSGAAISITAAGNGWYRCVLTGKPATSNNSNLRFLISGTTGDLVSTYTGDGTTSVYLWGAQLNLANMEGGVTSSLTTYYSTTTAAYYAPRFDYNPTTLAPQGLLIEEARTNSIRNNTMVGAVAGTPGTLPTNWTVTNSANLTTNVVAFGVINGINYIDLQITGTTNATAYVLTWEATTQIAASSGQTWASSWWWSIIGGDFANVTAAFMDIRELDGAGSQLASGAVSVSLPTSAFNRVSATRTNSIASTAYIQPRIRFVVNNTAAVNFTLRIGLPQLELGAFATSVIPTTTTALTRNADAASMTGTNFSSWYNASEGTVVVNTSAAFSGTNVAFSASDGTNNNAINIYWNSALVQFQIRSSGSTQAILAASTSTSFKRAGAYQANNFAASLDGGSVNTDTSGAIPTVDRLSIGSLGAGGSILNGTISRIAYYPVRLANTTLQALTA